MSLSLRRVTMFVGPISMIIFVKDLVSRPSLRYRLFPNDDCCSLIEKLKQVVCGGRQSLQKSNRPQMKRALLRYFFGYF